MELAKFIDHTYLQPDAQKKDIDKILAEAKQYHFASVCISPIWVSYAHKELAGSGVNVVTVIGFPEGATPTSVKAFETKQAIADGADEVDMVIPIGFLKDGASSPRKLALTSSKLRRASPNGALQSKMSSSCARPLGRTWVSRHRAASATARKPKPW